MMHTNSQPAGMDARRLRYPFVAALLALSFWCAAAVADPVSEAVAQTERSRFAAMVARDVEKLERLVADDLYYCHSSAEVENKAQFLETIRSQRLRYEALDVREMDVRVVAPNVAVVNGMVHFRGSVGGRTVEFDLRYFDAYVLRDGRWQLIAWQSTRVPEARPASSGAQTDPSR